MMLELEQANHSKDDLVGHLQHVESLLNQCAGEMEMTKGVLAQKERECQYLGTELKERIKVFENMKQEMLEEQKTIEARAKQEKDNIMRDVEAKQKDVLDITIKFDEAVKAKQTFEGKAE
jgi:hypothetical protein